MSMNTPAFLRHSCDFSLGLPSTLRARFTLPLDSKQVTYRTFQFIRHSSELMPGGSPRFQTNRHIEQLYDDLETLFSYAATGFVGMTLSDFSAQASTSTTEPGDMCRSTDCR